jgi:thiol-disulfide isomerase/thioredoxin
LENAEYNISGSIMEPVIETTSKAQKDLNDYNERIRPFEETQSALIDAYYEAADREDHDAMDSIMALYEKNYAAQMVFDSAYIDDNPASFASVLVLRGSFHSMETEGLEKTLNELDPRLRQLAEYKEMYRIMEHQKEVAVGKPYVDFGLKTPAGEMLRVSDAHGGNNVLLIDFWASWCGPCRRANPELVQLFKEYHEKGLEILGVSLDEDSASWISAIEEDGLLWHQISDLKGWGCEGSALYGVTAIPCSVLVDRDGIIRANDLQGHELREAIDRIL